MAQAAVAQETVSHEMAALKTGLRAMWMSGDYDRFSRYMEGTAREFYDRLDVGPGSRLLDVACGGGQLALIAARDGADVTGVDIAANSVLRAAARARGEGLQARFLEGDAEDLPFEDASFDVVASLIGAMFAPRPERVAAEMLRVCAPGGLIAMANWTAEGFIGRMFKTIASYIAPPGMPSPLLWGNEDKVRERFGKGVAVLKMTRRHYVFDYPFAPEEVVEFFARYYGPTYRAFGTLEGETRERLRQDLVALWTVANEAGDGATVVKAEYLEVVAERA